MENMEAVETGLAMPEETAESTVDTATQTEETVDTQPEQPAAAEGEGATPPAAADDATAQPTGESEPITIPVRFNHEDRELTVDEAKNYAEMGLAYERITPTMDKLRMLATGCGKTVEEMVDTFVQANNRLLRNKFLEETGGNERAADILLADEQRKRQEAFRAGKEQETQAAQAKKQETHDRMAAEFLELQAEFPDIDSVKRVPKSVLDAAAKGTHMLDAYLRYRHKEGRRVEQNRAQQAAAAAATTGSVQSGGAAKEEDPLIAALMDGVNAAL